MGLTHLRRAVGPEAVACKCGGFLHVEFPPCAPSSMSTGSICTIAPCGKHGTNGSTYTRSAKHLPKGCNIVAINYYTARVSGSGNPTSPKDQNTYLKALRTLPNLRIHFGNFQVTNTWMALAHPLQFWPPAPAPYPIPESVCAIKTEEKGSDVNLGAHLVRDAFCNAFEHAVIVTNDTDPREPLRLVVEDVKLPATLLTPTNNPAVTLKKLATEVRHLGPYLGVSQFPDPVIGLDGSPISKPTEW
jgi:hypothetical protein